MVVTSSPPEFVKIADDDDISILYSWSNNKKKGTNKANPISVENYSNTIEDVDIQLAMMSSFTNPVRNKARTFIDLSANAKHPNGKMSLFRSSGISIFEPGQSSRNVKDNDKDDGYVDDVISTVFLCEICVDYKEMSESFRIKGCSHSYCNECIHKYVASKIQENVSQVRCPVSGCAGVLEPEYCRSILPAEVFDRWGDALCEALILACNKFYCPYKDCSALLIMDDDDESGWIVESECPVCRRLFCAKCKVAWHAGVECGEFQKLHKDEREREDIMLMQLAKDKKWIRCPQCKFYVEKSEGCLFMKCRCGYTFCYNCGAHLKHHYCTKCNRTY